ncbi:HEPN domain-containing protein [Aliterella atlantica]|uniref:HEPN domain-containing protein n=1 Tax=Aliterella atlantica TaxID=1827278 RepID=UPI0006990B7E|nr:HEPN domain-containing protein [Aliterella atlantica]
MNQALLITSFRHLKITEQIDEYIEIITGINITNNKSIFKKLLTPKLAQAIGFLEFDYLLNAPNIVFGEYDNDTLKDMEDHPEVLLLAIIWWIEALFRNAWLIKDHAMECDAAFLQVNYNESHSQLFSNYLAARPAFSDGTYSEEILMSIDELKAWGIKNDQIESYLHTKQSSSISFMMEKGFSRTGRALKFIAAARNSPNLAFRITHYCSALETLFTTDSAELAHKLSERVAFFLGAQGHSKEKVFSNIKKAYTVRSKLTHGDTLSAKQIEELPLISRTCDQHLREIINTLFSQEQLLRVFDSHNEGVETYFHKLILNT